MKSVRGWLRHVKEKQSLVLGSQYSGLRTDLAAHMFEHLDADERVERVLPVVEDVAVVHEVHANAALETSFSDSLLRDCLLLDGERECVDLTAIRRSSLCAGEGAPRENGRRNAVSGQIRKPEARDAPLSRALPIRCRTRGVGRQA